MKRIIFINRFFFPDTSATSQLLSDLAFSLAGRGNDVHVITSRQRYEQPDARLPPLETSEGVTVHRVLTTRFGRSATLGRGFDYLSFYASVWRSVLAIAQDGDILVAMTDPPLLCVVAMQAAKRRRFHLVNWLQDLYPEVATELGVPFVRGVTGRGLARLRDRSLQIAAANIAVGDLMADKINARGIPSDRIHVIPNWCDDEEIGAVDAADNPLRREWGLHDRFVIGYSGNLGRAHEFDTVLAAAERLRDDGMVFLFIGGGSKFDELKRHVDSRGLNHLFRFIPYQERALLKYSLSVADVHWVSLKPNLEGLIVPSKFYGIAAAGRSIIVIGASDGELARLVRQNDCGFIVAPGDAAALSDVLLRTSSDAEGRAVMGGRARKMLETHFTRRQALARWRDLLDTIG
ncbi:MAG: colanic acid biosynthesis glycosyl transferase WcaI [Alphaproteobacteria bacterium]|jgi:glycosyltransferase involved in cell wall biosynthesis|nr:colanic acid biosynthesis glycosyl transferase WcaI [Alphaproteobacteria bacterium]